MALALVESGWKRIRDHLEIEKHRLYEEMKNYPRPIPACDIQFNHLLEERAGLSQELVRLHQVSQESPDGPDSIKALEEFIRSSSYLDEAAKQRLSSSLKEGRADCSNWFAGSNKPTMESPGKGSS